MIDVFMKYHDPNRSEEDHNKFLKKYLKSWEKESQINENEIQI